MSIIETHYKKEQRHWRKNAIRVALVFLTTALIVWFLPRREGKQYAYEVGEPWRYGTVIAKYDFPIYKTDEAISYEKDSLLSQFQPYFIYDHNVEGEVLARFKQDFKNGMPGLPAAYRNVVIDRLHRLYQSGIMEKPNYDQIMRGDTAKLVRVIFGKSTESLVISCLYSTMSAYESLLNDKTLAPERAALQKLDLTDYIEPNLFFDKERTETAKNDLLSGVSPASGMMMSGQKIIGVGDMVNDYNYRVLSSWEREMERRSASKSQLTNIFIGNFIYVFILVACFTCYLVLFRKDYFNKPRSIAMLYSFIVLYPILVSLMMKHVYFNLSVYIIPFALIPIFVRVFMDARTAFLTHTITVLISAIAVRYQFDFIIIQIVSGLVAIFSLREMSSRAQVFKTALFVALAMSATYMAIKLAQSGDDFNMDTNMLYHFLINGVLVLPAYPMMYLVEKTFGFISNITLIELSNTNKGLLRNLSEVAPGTFQHSITVGNLAAEIANKVGGNSTLVRTGALYHDIGKMVNPAFFTENQQGGVNPHDNLTDKELSLIHI